MLDDAVRVALLGLPEFAGVPIKTASVDVPEDDETEETGVAAVRIDAVTDDPDSPAGRRWFLCNVEVSITPKVPKPGKEADDPPLVSEADVRKHRARLVSGARKVTMDAINAAEVAGDAVLPDGQRVIRWELAPRPQRADVQRGQDDNTGVVLFSSKTTFDPETR